MTKVSPYPVGWEGPEGGATLRATRFRPFGIEPQSTLRLAASRINRALGALLHPRRALRERWAKRRLAEIVAQTRASFECEQYRRRRSAALKGLGR
jgi:hypothetical protein